MRRIALLLATAVLATGCVSQKTFDESQAELARCGQELELCRERGAAQLDLCMSVRRTQEQDLERLNRQIANCNRDVDALRRQAKQDLVTCVDDRRKVEGELADCRREIDAARSIAGELETRAADLRQRLQSEIADKTVEIEQLRDQLSVRVLDRILFRSGSADILPEGQAVLDKLAQALGDTDDMVRVEGHTDAVPIGEQLKAKYPTNWELSTARASSVVRYFESGELISPLRMEAVGFSKYRPVTSGERPEDLQRNRRVEIVLSAPKRR